MLILHGGNAWQSVEQSSITFSVPYWVSFVTSNFMQMVMENTRDERHEPMLKHDELSEQIGHMEPLALGGKTFYLYWILNSQTDFHHWMLLDQRLERKIGWIQGAMVNVSYIIGSGIFVGPALTLQLVGSGGMNLIIWFIGALVALSGTYTFMELGTMVTSQPKPLLINNIH